MYEINFTEKNVWPDFVPVFYFFVCSYPKEEHILVPTVEKVEFY